MDPLAVEAVSAAVTAAASTVASGVGRDLWEGLRGLIQRSFRRQSDGRRALATIESSPNDRQAAQAIAQALVDAASHDVRIAEELGAWLMEAKALEGDQGSVHNTVSGHAQVHGPLIQGRDFGGPINIGPAPPK